MRVQPEVAGVLKGATITGNSLKIEQQLDRGLYEAVNKILVALGGKWNRQAKAHLFDGDPWDAVQSAVETGEVTDWKKEFQFFQTPDELADSLVEVADIKDGHKVLEPSAGGGAIVRAIQRTKKKVFITTVEINPNMIPVFPEDNTFHITGDFLKIQGTIYFDRVIMNPPFSKGQDIKHVIHALECLKSGGKLVAITSPGWEYRTDKLHSAFREFMERPHCYAEDIPAGAFKASGTMVRSKMIWITT